MVLYDLFWTSFSHVCNHFYSKPLPNYSVISYVELIFSLKPVLFIECPYFKKKMVAFSVTQD